MAWHAYARKAPVASLSRQITNSRQNLPEGAHTGIVCLLKLVHMAKWSENSLDAFLGT